MSGEALPLDQRRLLAGECTRCGDPVPPERGANLCEPCTSDGTRYKKELRARRRANGRCAFCSKRSKKYRCRRCWKKYRDQRRSVRGTKRSVQQPGAPLPTKIEKRVEADGYERTRVRYTGRATRGAPSREQLEAEQERNIRFARRELDKFVEKFAIACSSQVQGLPPIQRDAVLHEALAPLGLAFRLLEEVEDFVKARMQSVTREDNKRNRPR